MPYYESRWGVIYLGDAREVLPELDTESLDLMATDPPYGVGWRSNTRKERFDPIEGDNSAENAHDLLGQLVPEIVRVTRRTRHLYTFGLPLQHPLLSVKAELIWDKGRVGSGDLSQAWGPAHEKIFFHIRAADKTNADRKSGALAARLRRGSVISVKRLSAMQVKRHPTEKPLDVMRQIIESSSIIGETVLDPFAGSGSTLVSAVLGSRRYVGIEIDEKYAEIAARRVESAEALMSQAHAC